MKRRLHNQQHTLASDLGRGLASPTNAPTTKGFGLFPVRPRDDARRNLLTVAHTWCTQILADLVADTTKQEASSAANGD
jgi:hypothetical protein